MALKIIFLVLGIIFCIYGGLVLAVINGSSLFNYIWILAGGVLLGLFFLYDRLHAVKVPVRRCIFIVVIVCLVIFAAVEVRIISAAVSDPDPGAEYVVLLGAKVNGERPSQEFSARIKACAEYAAENPSCVIITTGGKGADEGIAESACARKMLESMGVSGSRILSEDRSTSTKENLRFAAELIARDGGSTGDSVVIISSSFHLYRAGLIAEDEGYTDLSFKGANGLLLLIPHYCVREFAALVFSYIDR